MKCLLPIALLTGCATITNGTTQEMHFHPPPQQVCYITQGQTMLASIAQPTTLTVQRDNDAITMDCGNTKTLFAAHINAAGHTSILFLDFGLVDFATGALWEYSEQSD